MKFGSFDVQFTLPTMVDDTLCGIVANMVCDDNAGDGTAFVVRRATYSIIVEAWTYDLTTGALLTRFEEYPVPGYSVSQPHRIRIVGANKLFSFYIDDYWAHTFSYADTTWSDVATEIYAHSNGGVAITNIVLRDLSVSRDAVFVELEKNSQSAIDSVIQERPVEITPINLGGIRYSYSSGRATIPVVAAIISKHSERQTDSSGACSDAIVYCDDVKVIEDTSFEDNDGFSTRVFRLSSLDSDALKAGQVLLRRMREGQRAHDLQIRPDPRIEPGDIVTISYTHVGTGLSYTNTIIVESVTVSMNANETFMTVKGRENIP